MSALALLCKPSEAHIPNPWKRRLPFPKPTPSTQTLGNQRPQEEAEQLPTMASPSPFLISLIESIKTLTSLGHLSKAFNAFSAFHLHSTSSHLFLPPISSLLSCSINQRALSQGKQLHAHVMYLGFQDYSCIVHGLTSLYITCGLLEEAHAVALCSTNRHVLQWNMVISAYIGDGLSANALLAYKQMVERGIKADAFTYPSVLRACGEMLDLKLGKELHRCIESSEMEWNLFVQNALVAMYAKCGELGVARKLFDEMPERDVVSWNSMISGYASKRMWKKAFDLFEQMQETGAKLNSVTWNTIIGGWVRLGNHREALGLMSQMSGSNVDFVTLVVGLNACSHIGSIRLGKEIHGMTIRRSFDGLESVRNALITMYSRCKDTQRAYVLFQMLEKRSLVTWNAMISGFALSDQAEEASLVLRDMVYSGLRANYVTIVTYLALCARVANLQHGRELHCYITKCGFDDYRLLWNSLIDMYSKSGRISAAQRVFDRMSDCDEVSYTSLIAGYGMQGDGISALKLFDRMIDSGIKPDHISMVAVLSACSHAGLVSQGQTLFDKMVGSYGILPRMEHYSCMVDLFSRAGLLAKAEELLNRTPFPPTAAMWAALIGASQMYGNTEIGERAAKKLLEMRTDNAGHYVLIANMYAAAGCWEELAKVRTLMRDVGVRKAPGLAWADLGNGFHPFVVGDRSNPLAPEIYEILGELSEQMRDAGSGGNAELGQDEEPGV